MPADTASQSLLRIWRSPRRWFPRWPVLALPADCVYFGEVSLSGAVRPVAHTAQRLKEAEKLGFSTAVLPTASSELPKGGAGKWKEVESLPDLVARIAGSRLKARQEQQDGD